MLRPPPLAVVLVAHTALPDRAQVLDRFVRRLHRDPDTPFAPSPAVPVVAGTISDDGALQSTLAGAERTAALVLLEDQAITDARFLLGLDRLVSTAPPSMLRVFPVPLTPNSYRVPNAVVRTNFLRFEEASGEQRWTRVESGLAHELCRWLQGRARSMASPQGGASEVPITVFLSHAKSDGSAIAAEFMEHLQKQTRLDSFFDAHDLPPGFPFARELENRIGESILLVIHTDAYGTREWCQREVLAAKRAGVPVVVVDALESTERRAFPYLGNVPTIRYRAGESNRHERVLDLLLDETLRQLHFRRRVERLVEESRGRKPVILSSAPELVRFALTREVERRDGTRPPRRTRHVLYPDPPLSGPEVDVLTHDAEPIRAESLTQFVARRAAHLTGKIVAVSTSEAHDPAALGLSSLHQRDVVVELVRHLFAVGARIAYGGDFRKAGFAELLVEVQRAHARFANSSSTGIISYVPEPLSTEERACYVDTVEFVNVVQATGESMATEARGRALRLRAMRRQIARDAMALVTIGGRTSDFAGWRPGIAEEIASAVAARQPVFLIGGFGGVAREYADATFLGGTIPSSAPPPVEIGVEPPDSLALPSPQQIVRALRRPALRNGLSKTENARLARSVDTDEIVALVLSGLARVTKATRAARERTGEW